MKTVISIKGLSLSIGEIIKIDTRRDMQRFEVIGIREDEFNRTIYDLEEVEYL